MQVSDTTTSPQLDTAPSRAAFLFVIATAFLTATGMTIINPVIPFLLQRYVSNEGDLAALIGWISAAYAICAFLATPVLGALSDRFGRRPLLLICMLGSAVGYAIFGFGGALWVLFLGRIIDGITGGNFGIAFAYIADITPPQKRGTYFGLVGAIAGIGTILGPVIGGFAAHLGYDAPIYLAATLFLLNAVLGFFAMPESLAPQNRTQRLEAAHFNPFAQLRATLAMGQLRWLFLAAFLFELPFAAMVSTLAILIKDSLNWDADKIGLVFLAVGVTDIVVQGGLIGRLTALLGELRLAIICSLIVSIGYILIGSIALVGAARSSSSSAQSCWQAVKAYSSRR